MAIVLGLLPANPSIVVGSSQEFTATVTGAPVDATTTYVWTVDGNTQSSVESNMTYAAATSGSKVVKVVATTKLNDG